jgi:hypothetical protein
LPARDTANHNMVRSESIGEMISTCSEEWRHETKVAYLLSLPLPQAQPANPFMGPDPKAHTRRTTAGIAAGWAGPGILGKACFVSRWKASQQLPEANSQRGRSPSSGYDPCPLPWPAISSAGLTGCTGKTAATMTTTLIMDAMIQDLGRQVQSVR